MPDFQETLLSKAFRVLPGNEFNRTWGELREEGSFVYELVLPEGGSWEEFRDKAYPLFAKYLKSKFLNPEYPSGVVVGVFFQDHSYLLKGLAFIQAYRELEGLEDPEELHSRVLQWLAA
jgi:hypothetical protein